MVAIDNGDDARSYDDWSLAVLKVELRRRVNMEFVLSFTFRKGWKTGGRMEDPGG